MRMMGVCKIKTSIAEIGELERLLDLQALHEGDGFLQLVALLAADAQFITLDRDLNLQLGVLDVLDDLLGQRLLDALFDDDFLAARIAGCLLLVLELKAAGIEL